MSTNIVHWVDGAEFEGASDAWAEVTNPATGQVTGRVALADENDANVVISAAARAATDWGRTSLARRTQIVFAFRELLNARKDELAAIITAEHGKVFSDAQGEIARGPRGRRVRVRHLPPPQGRSHRGRLDRRGRPLASGSRSASSASSARSTSPRWCRCGSSPSRSPPATPSSSSRARRTRAQPAGSPRLWKEAGLPDGVFNVLHGDKTAVDALLTSPDVQAISFVGSTPIAQYVYETASRHGKRVQALGGAKNHMVVLPDADLDLAADAAVNAGYGSAGERCMAISVLVAVEPIADDLVARIAERTRTLVIGDGGLDATAATDGGKEADMGPLVTKPHRDRVAGFIASGEEAGAKVVVDGRDVATRGADQGFFLGPTLFDNVTPDMDIYREEIFGPVLSVVRVGSYDEAVDLINANDYGNGTAIFTNDGGAARRFEADVEVGMIGVNVPVPVPVAYYSFGGWKRSLFGDTHAHGVEGVHFFTRGKVVTTRWIDPANRPAGGLELGFPRNV